MDSPFREAFSKIFISYEPVFSGLTVKFNSVEVPDVNVANVLEVSPLTSFKFGENVKFIFAFVRFEKALAVMTTLIG